MTKYQKVRNSPARTINDVERRIEKYTQDYHLEDDKKTKAHTANRLSQLYQKKFRLLQSQNPYNTVAIEEALKHNATWLGIGYKAGLPSVCYQFALAIKHRHNPSKVNASYVLKELENLKDASPHNDLKGLTIDETGMKKLLSYSFQAGERNASWFMAQSIFFKGKPENKPYLNLLTDSGFDINNTTHGLILTVATLGNHLRASQALYTKLTTNRDYQTIVENILDGFEENLFSVLGWATKIAEEDKSFSQKMRKYTSKKVINSFKSRAIENTGGATALKYRLIQKHYPS